MECLKTVWITNRCWVEYFVKNDKLLILEKWDKTGCKIEKIKPCTQTNKTTFMYLICTKLLNYALIQPTNIFLFLLSKCAFYLGLWYNFNFIFNSIQDVFNISKHILMLADRLYFHMWPTIPQQI